FVGEIGGNLPQKAKIKILFDALNLGLCLLWLLSSTASADEYPLFSNPSARRACGLPSHVVAAIAVDTGLQLDTSLHRSTGGAGRIFPESWSDHRFPERRDLRGNGRCHSAGAAV